jgi:hypothetical protein
MAQETLLSAARRAVRFFQIDESHGSLTTVETVAAMQTLHRQVLIETARQNAAQAAAAAETAEAPAVTEVAPD